MCHQEAQVGDAGFEVVHEAGNATLLLPAHSRRRFPPKLARNRAGLIDRLDQ
jgi:hypothetical protein